MLAAIGHKVGYMGPIGAGTIAKLVHNMVSLATRAILAEGFTLGVKAGVTPEAMLEALRGASFGQGLVLSQMVPNVVFKGDFDTVRFALQARAQGHRAGHRARPRVRRADAHGRRSPSRSWSRRSSRGWGDKDSAVPWTPPGGSGRRRRCGRRDEPARSTASASSSSPGSRRGREAA